MTKAIYTLGASNHSPRERQENDLYTTDPIVVKELLKNEKFARDVWEPACGLKHISNELTKHGYKVRNSDIVKYLPDNDIEVKDFLAIWEHWAGDIITNPPYKSALEFAQKALSVIDDGHKVAFFLRLQFLEGIKRQLFFSEHPPKHIYVCSRRVNCYINGELEFNRSSAVAYAWFVWEKGFKGEPTVRWIHK